MEPYRTLAMVYDMLRAHEDLDQWASYLYRFMIEHGIKSKAKVVDVACGTGDMTLYFYNRGYDIIGIDRSVEMLEMAAKKTMEAGIKIKWIQQDMKEMALHEPVDCILCVNDGVNYLINDEHVKACFSRFFDALKQGGLLLFDISSAYKLEGMAGQFFAEETDDAAYIWDNSFEDETNTLQMDISFYLKVEGGLFRRETEQHIQRAHKVDDLIKLLDECGFHKIKAYRAFTTLQHQADDNRVQFVAVKK